MKLEFHPEAEMELIEAAAYELRVPGLGERFEAEIRRATDLLLAHPEIGPPANPDLHKLILNRFPFALYYGVTSDASPWTTACQESPVTLMSARSITSASRALPRAPTVSRTS